MKLNEIHTITLGKYSAKYMVTMVDILNKTYLLRIVQLPKTKVGLIRTPEYIQMAYFATTLTNEKN
jgi:hypothetical protein